MVVSYSAQWWARMHVQQSCTTLARWGATKMIGTATCIVMMHCISKVCFGSLRNVNVDKYLDLISNKQKLTILSKYSKNVNTEHAKCLVKINFGNFLQYFAIKGVTCGVCLALCILHNIYSLDSGW